MIPLQVSVLSSLKLQKFCTFAVSSRYFEPPHSRRVTSEENFQNARGNSSDPNGAELSRVVVRVDLIRSCSANHHPLPPVKEFTGCLARAQAIRLFHGLDLPGEEIPETAEHRSRGPRQGGVSMM